MIKHEVAGWEVKYGYIKLWSPEIQELKNKLPTRFKIISKHETLHDHHFDTLNRIYAGKAFMSRFQPGQSIELNVVNRSLEIQE